MYQSTAYGGHGGHTDQASTASFNLNSINNNSNNVSQITDNMSQSLKVNKYSMTSRANNGFTAFYGTSSQQDEAKLAQI